MSCHLVKTCESSWEASLLRLRTVLLKASGLPGFHHDLISDTFFGFPFFCPTGNLLHAFPPADSLRFCVYLSLLCGLVWSGLAPFSNQEAEQVTGISHIFWKLLRERIPLARIPGFYEAERAGGISPVSSVGTC